MIHVVEARCIADFVIRVRCSDGVEGDVDLKGEFDGTVFVPLRDPAYFRSVQVHPELGTAVWPNGADLAPEFLRERAQGRQPPTDAASGQMAGRSCGTSASKQMSRAPARASRTTHMKPSSRHGSSTPMPESTRVNE